MESHFNPKQFECWLTSAYELKLDNGLDEIETPKRKDTGIPRTDDLISRAVEQLDPKTGEVIKPWDSIAEVIEANPGWFKEGLSKCARGGCLSYKGFGWRFTKWKQLNK